MKVLIAIPALNEEATIKSVLLDLQEYHPLSDVLVINDGSTDKTAKIASETGVAVVSHAVNLGVGAALGTAFKYASTNDYTHLIQLDADGQHRPEFLSDLLQHSSQSDVVIGSRFAGGGSFETTSTRRLAMRVIAWAVSSYSRSHLTDVTSGFRLAGPRAIALFAQHYPVEYLGDTVESVVLASREGLTVSEIPVVMNERAGGLPSQSVFKASFYTARIFMILVLAFFRRTPPSVKNFSFREKMGS
jgi:glycosyltransferase involved in cell wall biosynthesis